MGPEAGNLIDDRRITPEAARWYGTIALNAVGDIGVKTLSGSLDGPDGNENYHKKT